MAKIILVKPDGTEIKDRVKRIKDLDSDKILIGSLNTGTPPFLVFKDLNELI